MNVNVADYSDYWPPRTLWLRHGWHKDPAQVEQVCAWARANGLDPEQIPDNAPIIVGRGKHGLPPSLDEGPWLTVTVVINDPASYVAQPGDEGGPHSLITAHDRFRIRRTVPLKVPPPRDLFIDVTAEIQRAAAGDPAIAAWLAEREDGTGDLAEALGHDRHGHPGRGEMLAEVRRLRRVNSEWDLVMRPLISGLAERNVEVPLGWSYADAALAEIDRLREAR